MWGSFLAICLIFSSLLVAGQRGPISSHELAVQVSQTIGLYAITNAMGDRKWGPECHVEDLQKVKGSDPSFHLLELPYPTHVFTRQEASWMDNLFIADLSGSQRP